MGFTDSSVGVERACHLGGKGERVYVAALGQGDRAQKSHSQLMPGLFFFPSSIVPEPLMFGQTHDSLESSLHILALFYSKVKPR